MPFTPLNDRDIVRHTEGNAKTSGELIIPHNAKAKPLEGEIVAVALAPMTRIATP